MPQVEDTVENSGTLLPPSPELPAQPLTRREARARESSPLTRRGLILGAGGATAVLATGCTVRKIAGPSAPEAVAAALPRATTPVTPSTTAPAATATSSASATATATAGTAPWALAKNLDPALLIGRATYGRIPQVESDVERYGATAWLNAQLAPQRIKDPEGDAVRRMFPRLELSPSQVRARFKEGDWAVMTDVVVAHVGQATWSRRQLFEVMVDFWSNVLNVTCPSGDVWDTRHRYDRDVIRENALGKFRDMLVASAFHPSMLRYLDNANSTEKQPNENYARESMELHTVGVDAGYTEADVQRAALLMTGWEVKDGKAVFTPERHYVGKVKVMDFAAANSSAAQGRKVQEAYLTHLATHPATAREIARKLATRFVSDTPSPALVKHLAKIYLKGDTAIVPVLRALFASEEFTSSAGAKVRRPFETTVATLRTLGVTVPKQSQPLTDLYWSLNNVGHQPLGWAPPNGYPDVAAAWQSPAAALEQFNSTSALVHGWWPQKLGLPGPKDLLSHPPTGRSDVVDAVARKVLGRPATKAERSAASSLLSHTKLPASFKAGSWEQQETVALSAVLLLTSPAHLYR